MPLPRVLLQLDCDPQPSTFDAIVAIDAGVEILLRHGSVTPNSVVSLVHGAIFTRGVSDLAATAIFIGGSDCATAEAVAQKVQQTFLGPLRVSLLVDPSGANSTASAAVVAATRHLPSDPLAQKSCRALILGGTGPVGQRVARLLARKGIGVAVASRSLARASEVCQHIRLAVPQAVLLPVEGGSFVERGSAFEQAIAQADLIVAAGAAGALLLDAAGFALARQAKVLIDLNAVPPAGIVGIMSTDKGKQAGDAVLYGALSIGKLKMKIHRRAIEQLFESNTAVLDAEELLAIGREL